MGENQMTDMNGQVGDTVEEEVIDWYGVPGENNNIERIHGIYTSDDVSQILTFNTAMSIPGE